MVSLTEETLLLELLRGVTPMIVPVIGETPLAGALKRDKKRLVIVL